MLDYLVNKLNRKINLSYDGIRYYAMGSGENTCNPFYLRWLLPFLCKNSDFRWNLASEISTFLLIPLTFLLLLVLGCSFVSSICGALSVLGLSGVFWFNRRIPALVDSTAMCFCLVSLIFFYYDESFLFLSIIFSILAGCTKESSPLYIYLITFNPFLLLGFLSPVLMKLFKKEGKDQCEGLAKMAACKPFHTCIPLRNNNWHNFRLMVLPWGGLLAALFFPSVSLVLTLLLAYLLLWIVTDTIRVYQWAWICMVISCFTNLPEHFCILVSMLTIFNPFKGDGE